MPSAKEEFDDIFAGFSKLLLNTETETPDEITEIRRTFQTWSEAFKKVSGDHPTNVKLVGINKLFRLVVSLDRQACVLYDIGKIMFKSKSGAKATQEFLSDLIALVDQAKNTLGQGLAQAIKKHSPNLDQNTRTAITHVWQKNFKP